MASVETQVRTFPVFIHVKRFPNTKITSHKCVVPAILDPQFVAIRCKITDQHTLSADALRPCDSSKGFKAHSYKNSTLHSATHTRTQRSGNTKTNDKNEVQQKYTQTHISYNNYSHYWKHVCYYPGFQGKRWVHELLYGTLSTSLETNINVREMYTLCAIIVLSRIAIFCSLDIYKIHLW